MAGLVQKITYGWARSTTGVLPSLIVNAQEIQVAHLATSLARGTNSRRFQNRSGHNNRGIRR